MPSKPVKSRVCGTFEGFKKVKNGLFRCNIERYLVVIWRGRIRTIMGDFIGDGVVG